MRNQQPNLPSLSGISKLLIVSFGVFIAVATIALMTDIDIRNKPNPLTEQDHFKHMLWRSNAVNHIFKALGLIVPLLALLHFNNQNNQPQQGPR